MCVCLAEYISQLESEISGKVTENGELRARNRALAEENKRLSDLTRMLLSSPSFSDLLNQMSTNPAPIPQSSAQVENQPPAAQQELSRQPPKDVNPYAAVQQHQQQQIGMAMIPEHSVDFSNLSLENDPNSFNLQPRVFSLSTPELTSFVDTSILSGKTSNFVGEQLHSEDEKVQMPVMERLDEKVLAPAEPAPRLVDPEFESNPEFELYHSSSSSSATEDAEDAWQVDVFGGVQPEKVLARYELVDAAEEEQGALLAMERVLRMCARLEATRERIEQLLDF